MGVQVTLAGEYNLQSLYINISILSSYLFFFTSLGGFFSWTGFSRMEAWAFLYIPSIWKKDADEFRWMSFRCSRLWSYSFKISFRVLRRVISLHHIIFYEPVSHCAWFNKQSGMPFPHSQRSHIFPLPIWWPNLLFSTVNSWCGLWPKSQYTQKANLTGTQFGKMCLFFLNKAWWSVLDLSTSLIWWNTSSSAWDNYDNVSICIWRDKPHIKY